MKIILSTSLIYSAMAMVVWPCLAGCIDSSRRLFLTEYVNQNRSAEAKTLSEVKGLPNAPQIQSYSGFITVDPKYNSNLFFWFFPSLKNASNAPVIVWLEGGPGMSSIWTVFKLHGPLVVDENLTVSLNPYSWAQEFSVIYIDNPVGTGYSYTEDVNGFVTSQNQVADHLYEFLQQFYQIFGEYRANDLYISGESYAGKYVPALGYKLMQMSNESHINFKGVAIGNGWTDPMNQLDAFVDMKSTGLMDEKENDELKEVENKVRAYYHAGDILNANKLADIMYGRNSKDYETTGEATYYSSYYNLLYSNYTAIDTPDYYEKYLDLKATRKAIHVGSAPFSPSNGTVYQKLNGADMMIPVIDNMTALIPDYKVMLFVGNLDLIIGPAEINAMLENKEWKYYTEFYSAKRVPWKVDNNDPELAGYYKGFDNFSEVIVRNAGHFVSIEQPRSCLDMIKRFIYNIPFETPQ